MWWIIAISLSVVLLIIFLLLTPIVLQVNTEPRQFEMRITGIAKANLILKEKLWLQLWVLGFQFRIDLLKPAKKKPLEETERKTHRRKFSFPSPAAKLSAVVQSFYVRKFHCDVDSGNFLLNSWLYPAFHFIDPVHRNWNVNFMGQTIITITLENNLLRIIRAMLS
jgi:hypothetical protein